MTPARRFRARLLRVAFCALLRGAVPLLAGLTVLAGPAQAEFSKSYQFLKAVRDKDGQAVTDALAEPGTTIVNTRDSSSGETALHIVTGRRDLTWMTFLIAKGVDANARDSHGVTPLVLACDLGFLEGVQLLIDNGARVDDPSSTGETPLIAAVHRRDIGMMRALLKGGANPDRADNSGRSARDYARLDPKAQTLLQEIDANAKPRGGSQAKRYGPSL